jgi:hypothetical protein
LSNALGDNAAEDVVNWMNQMEAARSEFRELNELNHSRFTARLDTRFAGMDVRFAGMNARFAESDVRLEARLAEFRRSINSELETFRTEMRSEMFALRSELRGEMAALRLDLTTAIGAFDAKLERRFADLLKWSFVFWVGAVAAVAILAKALR